MNNEPVAWYNADDSSLSFKNHGGGWTPLYTHPVKEQEIEKLIGDLRNVAEAQGQKGCWDYDQYMLGLFNGLELALAIFEKREPQYRELPSHPVKELTDEEIKDFIATFPIIFTPDDLVTFARAILRKASEK